MKRAVLIRADAGAALGAGHVMRCLALAQAWQRAGGHAVFVPAMLTPALSERIRAEGFELVPLDARAGSADDAAATIAHARRVGVEWVVADGYGFDDAWQEMVQAAGLRLLVCDDCRHASHRHAHLVWNQNPGAAAADYATSGGTRRLLLGARYAMLRRDFEAWRAWRRETPTIARRVLVTLGGSDPENVTLTALQAVQMLPEIESVVVVGASNPHLATVQAAVADAPNIRVVVNATDMPELMAWADVAISAGGSTCWELAFMGLPAAVIVLAENQAGIAAELDRRGVCLSLGRHRGLAPQQIAEALNALLHDPGRRREMSARGRELVDGHGAARVAAALGARLTVTLVSDDSSWLNAFLPELKTEFERAGHAVRWIHDPAQIGPGDLAFFLSLSRIVSPDTLRRNAHNLVVHESALPRGRGWSPLTWQVLEGKNEIPVALIEAADGVDCGEIYLEDTIALRGDEMVEELRAGQAEATLRLCREFVARYPFGLSDGRQQTGAPSYYERRRPADSRLDPDRTLREQFNLLRVADPDRYPAFFELGARRYEVRVTPVNDDSRDAASMNAEKRRITILVTGAGGVAAPGLLGHLRAKGVRTIAADMDPTAAGLVAADRGCCIPAATAPGFVSAMRRICEEERVDVIVPLVDEELLPLQELAGASLHVLTPRAAFIKTCLDKFRLCQELARHGISFPRTCLAGDDLAALHYPVILKPRTGRGSRGVVRVDSVDALRRKLETLDRAVEEMMIQELVDGPEFTVSVVVGRDGAVQAVVPKEIIVKRGVTQAAVTRKHPRIEALCQRLQETLRADGPFNVQLRLHPVSGEPLLFEINPRFSTTVTHTMAAGVDELFGLALQAVHGRDAYAFGAWTENLVLRRRSVDEFLTEADYMNERESKTCDYRR